MGINFDALDLCMACVSMYSRFSNRHRAFYPLSAGTGLGDNYRNAFDSSGSI